MTYTKKQVLPALHNSAKVTNPDLKDIGERNYTSTILKYANLAVKFPQLETDAKTVVPAINEVRVVPNPPIHLPFTLTDENNDPLTTENGDHLIGETTIDVPDLRTVQIRGTIYKITGSGGASSLDELTDVAITNPTTGQTLIYNATTHQWENQDGGGGGGDYTAGAGIYFTGNNNSVINADAGRFGTQTGAEVFNDYTNNTASGYYSHAEGVDTHAEGSYSHTEGYSNRTTGEAAHAEGAYNLASGTDSHAEGSYTTASGTLSHSEGGSTTASGTYSHAEGQQSQAVNTAAHAEGMGTLSSSTYSHAEGQETKAMGIASHSEGFRTEATNNYSHAEGQNSKVYSTAGHAEGYQTEAWSTSSHSEGYNVRAYGNYSHSEGFETRVTGDAGHAEGYQTDSQGTAAHVEGYQTKANQTGAHAEGYLTNAYALYAHTQNLGTQVIHEAGTAIGKYNDYTGNFPTGLALTIGNGTDTSHRSNAVRVEFSGDTYIAGDLTTGVQLSTVAQTVGAAINELAAGGGGGGSVDPIPGAFIYGLFS